MDKKIHFIQKKLEIILKKKYSKNYIKLNILPIIDYINSSNQNKFIIGGSADLAASTKQIVSNEVFGPENYGMFEKIGLDSLKILSKDAILFLANKKFRRVALSEPKRYIHSFFYNEAKQLVTQLAPSDLIPCQKIGIRPQLVDWQSKELVMDFNIQHQQNHTHILNAISPAFTCCFAFAKHICKHYLNI